MRFNRFSKKWIVASSVALLAATASALASLGCGGGGGGGGGSSSTTVSKVTYSGTVTDSSGDPLVGDTVSFDGSSTYTTTTSSSGAFTLSVADSALTGSDELVVSDAAGTEVATYTISGSSSISGIAITIGPPAPPTGLSVKR